MRRRDLLMSLPLATLVPLFMRRLVRAEDTPIPRRKLGKTGELVSIIGLGGFHLGVQKDERESIRIIRQGLDAGINFLDNCWDYNDGQSELRMGKALQDGYRDKAFLMTKIDGRTHKAATQQIEESLKRLRTDRIDLLQFHEVIRDSDPDAIFGQDGALQAALDAKRAGKVRYLGFTGHKSPHIHKHMLETAFAHDFRFDTVQMPLNLLDTHHDSFEKIVLPILVQHEIGVLGMKPLLGHGQLVKLAGVSAIDALHYALSLPTSVVITGCDSLPILEQALKAARTFRPLSDQQRAGLLAKTEKLAQSGEHELYKSSQHFDGTTKHPEWLG
jgi:aryl-alcohol dehydrogenase-like predicted oxidoreductase